MVEVEKYNNCLNSEKINWEKIRENTSLLLDAMELVEDKKNACAVKSPEICSHILMDYKNIDKSVYLQLIDLIYSNEEIAHSHLTYQNERYSFLYASLLNSFLGLTEEQKKYAVHEAMFNRMNHGGRAYDIRYQILKNPNWNFEEKRKLIYDFYEDEYDFMLHVDAFERKVLHHPANFKNSIVSVMQEDRLYDYSLFDLEKMYQDSVIAVEVFDEINFCRMLHQVRPITLRKNKCFYKDKANNS